MGCGHHCAELGWNRVGYVVCRQLVPQITPTRPEDTQRLEIAVCLRRAGGTPLTRHHPASPSELAELGELFNATDVIRNIKTLVL